MITILFGLTATLFTVLGGLFALKFKDKLHLILGFSAGAVLGVAFFDLLPEAIELSNSQYSVGFVTAVVALGFVIFMILDRLIALHPHDEEPHHNHRGKLGAGSMAIHSFLDGLAIGLAFQVSSAVGLVVAIAVLLHDFSDGINTVGFIIKNKGTSKQALSWLALDAIAPAIGAFSTLFFSLTETTLGLILAVFCGFFLYIGASDLLPESYHQHPTLWTTTMTILGVLVLFTVIKLAGL